AQNRGRHRRKQQPGERQDREIPEDLQRPEEPGMALGTQFSDAPGDQQVEAREDRERRENAAEERPSLRRRESVAEGGRDRGKERRHRAPAADTGGSARLSPPGPPLYSALHSFESRLPIMASAAHDVVGIGNAIVDV